jgi:hypothetical protein
MRLVLGHKQARRLSSTLTRAAAQAILRHLCTASLRGASRTAVVTCPATVGRPAPRLVVELAQSAGYEYAVGCVFRVGASSEKAAVRR